METVVSLRAKMSSSAMKTDRTAAERERERGREQERETLVIQPNYLFIFIVMYDIPSFVMRTVLRRSGARSEIQVYRASSRKLAMERVRTLREVSLVMKSGMLGSVVVVTTLSPSEVFQERFPEPKQSIEREVPSEAWMRLGPLSEGLSIRMTAARERERERE